MKRYYILLIILSCIIQPGISQSVGTWKTYLAYNDATAIAEGNNYVFAVANGSLYSYGKDDESINFYSKQTGLSDSDISTIAYNPDKNTLVITYSNGNIDLLSEKGIKNLNFLKESNFQDKTINTIYNYNEHAYLCGKFGILVLNVEKQEIKETYRLNKSVTSVVINGNEIYTVADNKIMMASLSDNLIDPNNWNNFTTNNTNIDNGTVKQLCLFQNTLCILTNSGIYYRSNNGYQRLLNGNNLFSMKVAGNKLITFTNTTSKNDLYIYLSLTESEKTTVDNRIYDVSSLKDENTFYFATGTTGILGLKRTGSNQYETTVSNLNTDGPIRNYNAFLRIHNNKLYIGGGGRGNDRLNNAGTVAIYDIRNQSWYNYDQPKIAAAAGVRFSDVTSIAVDPEDETHLYVSTWGEGVYEFKENELVQRYDYTNSTLNTVVYTNDDPNRPNPNYVRIEGLCFDNNNNLWMTNSAPEPIKILKADGTWSKIGFSGISSPSLNDKILIRSNGDKWVNFVRANYAGILVFNENETIDDTSDDVYRHFTSMTDANGNAVGETEYHCITEDKNNTIWIGTNRGPVIVYNPSNVLKNVESRVSFNRIIRTGEEEANYYFLGNERINAIAVDGGNRKWIGTAGSGLFLVSEDGQETLEQFTAENSYLLSNNIQSIAIDHKTGEVFIGTDKGLVSYFGEAIQGSESYSEVYAYPNPVRPDFNEKVIITGLMENSNVKITDVKGNLIYQAKSFGGQISWDCKNKSGKRVASGVYLVFAATPEGKESVVTKIAVVQ